MGSVRIWEKWKKGTRGGYYVYVAEGRILRHISRYAVKKDKADNNLFYEVPINKILGREMFVFSFSNSGVGHISEHRIEDWISSKFYPKERKWSGLLEKEGVERLKDYEFEIANAELKQLVKEFESSYVQMIDEIKNYQKKLGFEIFFAEHAERTQEAFINPKACYLACMSLPDDRKRKMSLGRVCEWIYQLWVLKLFCEAVETREIVKREWASKPYWWIEQGKPHPTCILSTPFGYLTCWFEFQVHEMIHLKGAFTRKREHVRPDIVVAKGFHESVKSLDRIDLIIECKAREFRYWKNDIYSQIPAYLEEFNPDSLILASFSPIPNNAKRFLDSRGIVVVDDLRLSNRERIKLFIENVKNPT